MFDVLDMLVPELEGTSRVQRESAFGPVEDDRVAFRNVVIGRVSPQVRYHEVVLAGESPAIRSWTLLVGAKEAADAARDDRTWSAYIESLAAFLGAQRDWLVIFEAD